MKKFFLLFTLMVSLSTFTFAQYNSFMQGWEASQQEIRRMEEEEEKRRRIEEERRRIEEEQQLKSLQMSKENFVHDNLGKALEKSLFNIREGARLSIDQLSVKSSNPKYAKDIIYDQIVEILLDKGYKVVAKEYLERLYQEQQAQQSGIYNENTVVQENNMSAVGYFLNIRILDEHDSGPSIRVQVINISTGEYEGNATITF